MRRNDDIAEVGLTSIKFDARREGDGAIATLQVAGREPLRARVKARRENGEEEPDVERLATLIVLRNALDKAEDLPLPIPVKGALALAHRLIEARYRMETTGDRANFQEVLESAKESPVRIIRAVAAGLQEFLER